MNDPRHTPFSQIVIVAAMVAVMMIIASAIQG